MAEITAVTADGVQHKFPIGTPQNVIDGVIKTYVTTQRLKGETEKYPKPKPGPSLWEAATTPVVGNDIEEAVRSRISAIAGKHLLPIIAGPAAAVANVPASLIAAPVEFGRRMLTPLNIGTMGAGGVTQAIKEAPAVPAAVKAVATAAELGGGAAFGAQGAAQAVEGRRPGETGLQEFERRVGGAGQALLSVAPLAHPFTKGVEGEKAPFVKRMLRGAVGAGESKVSGIMQAEADKAAQAAEEYRTATSAAESAGKFKDFENQQAWEVKKAEAAQKYEAEAKAAREKWEKQTADVKAKNLEAVAKARSDYIAKLRDFDEKTKINGRRTALERGKQDLAQVIKANVDETRGTVAGKLDQRWEALRNTLGKDTPIDSTSVYEAIRKARQEYLRGAPPDLSEFDRILNEMGLPRAEKLTADAMQMSPGEMSRRFSPEFMQMIRREGTQLNVGDALVHRSALGRKIASGATPGNVKQALRIVQESLDGQIGKVAEAKGEAGVFDNLKRDYRQYMKDWVDMSPAASLGGSSLARVAASTGPYTQLFLEGRGMSDFIQRFSRYREYGARPEAAQAFSRVQDEYKSLPGRKVVVKPTYTPPKLQPELGMPKVEPPGEIPEPTPEARTVPKRRIVTPRTPAQIREKLIADWADRPFRWWEYGVAMTPTPFAIEPWLRLSLRLPRVRNWTASGK